MTRAFLFCWLVSVPTLASPMLPTAQLTDLPTEQDILTEAKRQDFFSPSLALAVAIVESKLNPQAIHVEKNNSGVSRGLMMLKLETAKMLGYKGDAKGLLNWRTNLYFGMKYLELQTERYNGKIKHTLAAYNAGTAFVCRTGLTTRGKPCTIGKFTNQGYVDRALKEYQRIEREHKTSLGTS